MRLFARLSPTGKLIVDVGGELVGVGVTDTNPAAVCLVTVRLAVIALAFAGTPGAPATWNVLGVCAKNTPLSPTPLRVSRRRTGVIETYVDPTPVFIWVTFVAQSVECANSPACQTALGSWGSWATPT